MILLWCHICDSCFFSPQTTGFLSEAQFSVEAPETLDPLFKFHETIAKVGPQLFFLLPPVKSPWQNDCFIIKLYNNVRVLKHAKGKEKKKPLNPCTRMHKKQHPDSESGCGS